MKDEGTESQTIRGIIEDSEIINHVQQRPLVVMRCGSRDGVRVGVCFGCARSSRRESKKKDQSNTLHEAQQRATNIDNNQDLPPTGKIIKIIKIIL